MTGQAIFQVTQSIKAWSQDSNLDSLAQGSAQLNNTTVSVHLLWKLLPFSSFPRDMKVSSGYPLFC